MYYVYRYMSGDEWIYVGKADASHVKNELSIRIYAHSKDERFINLKKECEISYCILDSRNDMDVMEKMLIKIHNPVLNIVDRTSYDLPFEYNESKVTWYEYSGYCDEKQLTNIHLKSPKIYHEIIRTLREGHGLSQANIAKILGTTQQMYSRYENGECEMPIRHVTSLCNFYGVSADYLLYKT